MGERVHIIKALVGGNEAVSRPVSYSTPSAPFCRE